MSASTRPEDIVIGALGQNHLGKVKAKVGGANAILKGDIVIVTDLFFSPRGEPRAGEVARGVVGVTGRMFLAANAAAVGRQVVLVNWLPFQMDTSAASIDDAVYMDPLTGAPTLTTSTNAITIGRVVKVGTVANGGAVFLQAPGAEGSSQVFSGTATIPSAATSVVVAVGAQYTGKRAVVSWADDPGSAAKLWADVVSAGNLTINCDVAPGADKDIHYIIDGR